MDTMTARNRLAIVVRDLAHQQCSALALRHPNKKTKYILDCFDFVTRLGGPKAVKERLLALPGREAKIQFLDAFPGIGPKYARNIMMDVYHEDFRSSVALDSRIMGISEDLGLSFPSYEDHEAFYLEVAQLVGLNGWELDRLLFNFLPEVRSRLGIGVPQRGLARQTPNPAGRVKRRRCAQRRQDAKRTCEAGPHV
jgi:hypothetical protein